jgi:hypothetical protein
MKAIVFLLGLGTLLITTACDEDREHWHHHHEGAYGGSYDTYPEYRSWGHGEYRGYQDYRGGYPDDRWDRRYVY